jgi:hypothetical protein
MCRVMEAVQTAFQARRAHKWCAATGSTRSPVILPEIDARDPETVGESLDQGDGCACRCATARRRGSCETAGRASMHDGARRRQTVTCNVEGRDVGSFVEEARDACAKNVKLPPDSDISDGAERRNEEAHAETRALRPFGVALFWHHPALGWSLAAARLVDLVLDELRHSRWSAACSRSSRGRPARASVRSWVS